VLFDIPYPKWLVLQLLLYSLIVVKVIAPVCFNKAHVCFNKAHVEAIIYLTMAPQGYLGFTPGGDGAHYVYIENVPNRWQPPGGGGVGGGGPPVTTFAAVAGGTRTAGIANLTGVMCTQTQSKGWMLWTGDYANSSTNTTFTTNKNSTTNCIAKNWSKKYRLLANRKEPPIIVDGVLHLMMARSHLLQRGPIQDQLQTQRLEVQITHSFWL
jgi:hypothetical protein